MRVEDRNEERGRSVRALRLCVDAALRLHEADRLQHAGDALGEHDVVLAGGQDGLLVGLAEAPSFPANARIVAAWFPSNERGTASAFFNSGQYFATVMFAPHIPAKRREARMTYNAVRPVMAEPNAKIR